MELLRVESRFSFLGGVNLLGKSFLPRMTLTELTCSKLDFLAGRSISPLYGSVLMGLLMEFLVSDMRILAPVIFLFGGLAVSESASQ